MQTVGVEIPKELLALLKRSRLGSRPVPEQVRIALAIHLFQEGVISAGKAAIVSGESRAAFELLLGEMGIPPVRYDTADYQKERQALRRAYRGQ